MGVEFYEGVLGELRAEAARKLLSQREIAALLGHNQQWLSRRLSGEVPMSLPDFVDICAVLEVSPVEVLGRVG